MNNTINILIDRRMRAKINSNTTSNPMFKEENRGFVEIIDVVISMLREGKSMVKVDEHLINYEKANKHQKNKLIGQYSAINYILNDMERDV